MAQSKNVMCEVLNVPGLSQADMERACPFIDPIPELTDMERHNALKKLGDENMINPIILVPHNCTVRFGICTKVCGCAD